MRRLPTAVTGLVAAAFLFLAGCQGEETGPSGDGAGAQERSLPVPGGFDFLVLALSWSPSYCASEGANASRQQCGDGSDPFAFIVHGLWPQFTRGFPADCPTDRPLTVPRSLSDSMLDIMPATGLIRHEWTRHGTCSNLSQRDYFTLTRKAFETIAIPREFEAAGGYRSIDPAAVESAFIAANPGLPANAIAVTCDRRYIRDVRICMARDLTGFVSCPEVDGDACGRRKAVMPPAR